MMTNISMTGANSGMQVALNSGQMNQYFSPPERAQTPPEPLSTVPFSRNPDFVDRESLLADRTLLSDIYEKCSAPDARLALVGMGGVGKSQLAIEYCYRTRVTSPETWVFWVHASNAARFEQGYRKIAEQAKITRCQESVTSMRSVANWLRDPKRKWILVLDNIDDNRFLYEPQYLEGGQGGAKMPPIEYLPHSANGCIIITTRDRRVALDFVTDSCIVQIDPMTQPDAVSLLEIMLGDQGKEPNRADVLKLAETLKYMPLAIEQAAAYIRRQFPLYSIQQYLRDFGRNDGERLKLLAHEAGRHYRDWEAKNSILMTWQLSFDQIRAENSSAADLLSLMSFFDRQAIPESLLHIQSTEYDQFSMRDSPISTSNKDENWFEVQTPIRGRVRQALHDRFKWLRPSFWTAGARSQNHQTPEPAEVGTRLEDTLPEHTIKSRENTLRDDILILRDYSLLSITPDHTLFEMHRLVQLATRKWLEAHGETEKWLKTFIRRLANAIPKEVDEQSREVCLSLFPHIESARMHRTSSNEVMIDRGSLLFETTVHLTAVVSPRAMLAISLASMEAFEQCLGPENHMTIYSAMYTGIAYLQLARYPDAEAIFEKVIEVEERLGRIDGYCAHTAMNNLICVYQEQGRLQEAESHALKAIEIRKKMIGPDSSLTLMSMGNLALIYQLQGRWEDAEKLGLEILEVRKRLQALESPANFTTILSIRNLVLTYQSLGRLSEAEELCQEVLQGIQQILDREHPHVISTMRYLAVIYRLQNRLTESESLLKQLSLISTKVLGERHPETLTIKANLSMVHWRQGNWEEGEALMKDVLVDQEKILGLEHYRTLQAMDFQISMYEEQDRLSEAEMLANKCLRIRTKTVGSEHPNTLDNMRSLASIWKKQGRKAAAIDLLTRCIYNRVCILPKDHPEIQSSRALLESWANESGTIYGACEG